MGFLGVILLVVLLIPIFAVLTDSPIGRAMARRLEAGRAAPPPGLTDLAERVELLSSEVDDLTRAVEVLQEENQFLQRLLEEGGGRRPLPPGPSP